MDPYVGVVCKAGFMLTALYVTCFWFLCCLLSNGTKNDVNMLLSLCLCSLPHRWKGSSMEQGTKNKLSSQIPCILQDVLCMVSFLGCPKILMLFHWSTSSQGYISYSSSLMLKCFYNIRVYLVSLYSINYFIAAQDPTCLGFRVNIKWQALGLLILVIFTALRYFCVEQNINSYSWSADSGLNCYDYHIYLIN